MDSSSLRSQISSLKRLKSHEALYTSRRNLSQAPANKLKGNRLSSSAPQMETLVPRNPKRTRSRRRRPRKTPRSSCRRLLRQEISKGFIPGMRRCVRLGWRGWRREIERRVRQRRRVVLRRRLESFWYGHLCWGGVCTVDEVFMLHLLAFCVSLFYKMKIFVRAWAVGRRVLDKRVYALTMMRYSTNKQISTINQINLGMHAKLITEPR